MAGRTRTCIVLARRLAGLAGATVVILAAWVAVPAVAVLFTGVAFTAGSNLRSDSQAARGSVVEASPLGDRAESFLGLVSRNGGDPTALFPEGWQAGGFDGGDMPGMVVDDMGGLRASPRMRCPSRATTAGLACGCRSAPATSAW